MTTITEENPIKSIITDAMFLTAGAKAPPPPKRNDEYRYYHCHLHMTGLKCKKVDGSSVLPSENYTKLLFVKSYIPESLDRHILKYQWIPDRVIIEDKST
jgi:hypothetical protein